MGVIKQQLHKLVEQTFSDKTELQYHARMMTRSFSDVVKNYHHQVESVEKYYLMFIRQGCLFLGCSFSKRGDGWLRQLSLNYRYGRFLIMFSMDPLHKEKYYLYLTDPLDYYDFSSLNAYPENQTIDGVLLLLKSLK